jgi:uncharacterized protein
MRGISSWPLWTEFTIVILVAFGYPILVSVIALFDSAPMPPIAASDLRHVLIYELIVIAILAPILRVRGWNLKVINIWPDLARTLQGVSLAIYSQMTFFALCLVLAIVMPQTLSSALTNPVATPGIGLGLLISAMVVNSIFEEVFVTGYVISALKDRYSARTAINVSVAIRLAYHLYQGALGVITIIATGPMFAL